VWWALYYGKWVKRRSFQSSGKPAPITIMLSFTGDAPAYCADKEHIDFFFFCAVYWKPKASEVSLRFKGQVHGFNAMQNNRKGGHFRAARSQPPLLFCWVSQAICGPIVLIRNVSIFSFSAGFFWEPKDSRVGLSSRKKGDELNIIGNGRKSGHFRAARSPLPLLIC